MLGNAEHILAPIFYKTKFPLDEDVMEGLGCLWYLGIIASLPLTYGFRALLFLVDEDTFKPFQRALFQRHLDQLVEQEMPKRKTAGVSEEQGAGEHFQRRLKRLTDDGEMVFESDSEELDEEEAKPKRWLGGRGA